MDEQEKVLSKLERITRSYNEFKQEKNREFINKVRENNEEIAKEEKIKHSKKMSVPEFVKQDKLILMIT